eukprot:Protomagalhaensia_sp_Gyna_25__446@NODE_120_length_5101_cov_30_677993_g94_i0_p2_GENE_NODE_120_length_5101_cov_30_677993_g94_i0NODE_120_length_5101_cov_30_677993_g94_i0_p2_ORF_typecomplete_len491_score93_62Pescadillo_N/PF06732_11/7_7e88Pescadillo_N/PF06732_11/9_1e03BRCT_2/PF16589_5/1_1e06_NODE_120_length_5101_cov_30_677993_g94_i0401512
MAFKENPGNKKGDAALYITRAPALRRLGVSLPDFRRLCILKGVFPRVPKKAQPDKVYYHIKDIQHLGREQLLDKFRKDKALAKKIRKAIAKKEPERARALYERNDKINLASILRERYPTLVHALRDLDDALSTVALFAALPVVNEAQISGEVITECKALTSRWLLLTAELKCVTKVFASIKGYYYQASLFGENITWIMPHEFTTPATTNVDLKIMATFLELYRALLNFMLFKLYRIAGFEYPPTCARDSLAVDGNWINLELKRVSPVDPSTYVDERASLALLSHTSEDEQRRSMFTTQVVYVARETPIKHLVYCLKAGGCRVAGFDESLQNQDDPLSPVSAEDESITHHVVDRPVEAMDWLGDKVTASVRAFIQPQWILDSFNIGKTLPTSPYAPGVPPPAHLSPFVDDKKEGYVPEERVVLSEWAGKDTLELKAMDQEVEKDEEEERRRIVALPSKKRKLAERIKAKETKKKENTEKLRERKKQHTAAA